MYRTLPLALLALTACEPDEGISKFADADQTYVLQTLNDVPFAAYATISFSPGHVAGTGPCNAFSTTQTAPYPWFDIGPILTTRMACPDLEAETVFFATLDRVTQSEVLEGTIILSNTDGDEMVFQAE